MRPLGVTGVALWLLGAITILTIAPSGQAQDVGESAIEAPLLDVSHAKRAYAWVETALAEQPGEAVIADPIPVTGLIGVRLTLRSDGFVVGQGVAYRPDLISALDQPGRPVDLVTLLAQATDQAKQGVLNSLADARLRAVLEGRSIPEPVQLNVADVHLRMVADLELAYDLQSIKLPSTSDTQDIFAQFAPCYHGLAFTDPTTGTWSWVWPGEAIARNISPSTYLTLGLKRLGLDRDAVQQLARPDGISLARFKTLHLVRPVRGLDPIVLVRSGPDLPRYTVDESQLVGMSDRLIEHLNSRFLPDHRMRGTYHPTSGRYDPPFASPEQAALACYAMVHHCRLLAVTRPLDNSRQVFLDRALEASKLIAWYALSLDKNPDPQVPALVLLTMLEVPAEKVDQPLRDRGADLLLKLIDETDQTNEPADEQPAKPKLKDAEAALSAAALATLYDRTRRPEVGQAARRLIDQVWDQPDHTPGISAMPWLLLAQQRAGDLLYPPDADDNSAQTLAQRRAILGQMIDRLCQYQVIEKPALGPDDVLGGFVLTPAPVGSPPNPDWRNAQALMLLAVALRDDSLTADHDKLGWLISAGYAARFVGQLMMEDNSCYYVRDRIGARGGMRMAPWDNRLALAPSAISLMALTELQTTLNAMHPEPPAPGLAPGLAPAPGPAPGPETPSEKAVTDN